MDFAHAGQFVGGLPGFGGRAARVVRSGQHLHGRSDAVEEEHRRGLAETVRRFFRVAHILQIPVAQVFTFALEFGEPVDEWHDRRADRELARILCQSDHRHVAAVTRAGDADSLRVGEAFAHEMLCAGDDVGDVGMAQHVAVGLLKLFAVAGAAAIVGAEHCPTLTQPHLHQRRPHVHILPRRAAVHIDQQRQSFCFAFRNEKQTRDRESVRRFPARHARQNEVARLHVVGQ